jgi:hypothetical protein
MRGLAQRNRGKEVFAFLARAALHPAHREYCIVPRSEPQHLHFGSGLSPAGSPRNPVSLRAQSCVNLCECTHWVFAAKSSRVSCHR